MSKFMNTLEVRYTPGNDNRWTLISPLFYHSDMTKSVITVPCGFVTDFASVPRVPFIFDMLGDIAQAAAALHDWLYASGTFPRKQADRIFREAVLVSGVPVWKAWLMYAAVRLFGNGYYLPGAYSSVD
jgi:hypothetical protein